MENTDSYKKIKEARTFSKFQRTEEIEDFMKHTYWEHNGEYEKEYEELIKAADHSSDFQFSKRAQSVMFQYYRFYNDWDLPYWVSVIPTSAYEQLEIQKKLEAKVNEVIIKEYNRFVKERSKDNQK